MIFHGCISSLCVNNLCLGGHMKITISQFVPFLKISQRTRQNPKQNRFCLGFYLTVLTVSLSECIGITNVCKTLLYKAAKIM